MALRANLNFLIECVSAHEELLLKSMVRLLNYRTEHNWTLGPGTVDLRIIGEEPPMPAVSTADTILWVGRTAGQKKPFLQFPIRANEFEIQLNALGAEVLLKKQVAASETLPQAIRPDESLLLRRWPPASMLRDYQRTKLSALMTGHPISLETLALRSGCSHHDCEKFCLELDHAGLLQRHLPAPSPAAAQSEEAPSKPGHDNSLLARIRRRLGI